LKRDEELGSVVRSVAADEHRAEAERHSRWRARALDRHVALIGFMGAGKSSVGRALAARLERPFFDTDLWVEERCGASVQSLFAAGRQLEFRRLEAEAVHAALAGPPAVVSLGGGALADVSTRDELNRRSFVIHLYVSWAEVKASLPALSIERPLLQRSLADVHTLYIERQKTYRDAHVRIHVPRDDVGRAVEHVLYALRRVEP
jgi:shikimate kinase